MIVFSLIFFVLLFNWPVYVFKVHCERILWLLLLHLRGNQNNPLDSVAIRRKKSNGLVKNDKVKSNNTVVNGNLASTHAYLTIVWF